MDTISEAPGLGANLAYPSVIVALSYHRGFRNACAIGGFMLALAACGGGNNPSPSPTPSQPTSNQPSPTPTLAANQVAITTTSDHRITTSLKVCVPGSTTACQTVDDVTLDTGSSGLRLLGPLTITLPSVTIAGTPLSECTGYSGGASGTGVLVGTSAFGPVQLADVYVGGEVASSVPIQVAGGSLDTCTAAFGTPIVAGGSLGNGLWGIGASIAVGGDCGDICASQSPSLLAGREYFTCTDTSCTPAQVPDAQQVQNPVTLFPTDNTGVVFALSALLSGVYSGSTLSGTLTFGVGTQANNAISNATVMTLPVSFAFGASTTTLRVDSGASNLVLPPAAFPTLPLCTANVQYYCPTSGATAKLNLTGANGATVSAVLTLGNADAIVAAGGGDIEDIAAPDPSAGGLNLIFGAPFFAGRTIYFTYPGTTTPSGPGPFVAF